jgi:hypothetical protein
MTHRQRNSLPTPAAPCVPRPIRAFVCTPGALVSLLCMPCHCFVSRAWSGSLAWAHAGAETAVRGPPAPPGSSAPPGTARRHAPHRAQAQFRWSEVQQNSRRRALRTRGQPRSGSSLARTAPGSQHMSQRWAAGVRWPGGVPGAGAVASLGLGGTLPCGATRVLLAVRASASARPRSKGPVFCDFAIGWQAAAALDKRCRCYFVARWSLARARLICGCTCGAWSCWQFARAGGACAV